MKSNAQQAGQRIGARARLIGELTALNMTPKEKIDFWSAALDELLDVFDELTADDAHSAVRH